MIYVFGIFLLYTAYKMLTNKNEEYNPRDSFVFRQMRKLMPITQSIEGEHFFVKRRHLRVATPLFVALIVIEVTDILFALDSIPAILAITSDPFLVFSSNILAILGLRSMYFFLSNMLQKFHYLEYSLVAILTFVGLKMLCSNFIHLPTWGSLLFIIIALGIGIFYSLHSQNSVKEK
jgi:tellurite resistance protein TerC